MKQIWSATGCYFQLPGAWRTINPLTQSCAEPTPGINDARENGADDADQPE
jgi:hypothetical protein